jgi:AcrR family transcriptional regulator
MSEEKKSSKMSRGAETREKMLVIAEELIARSGPEGFLLQDITERLGLTPPAIYNHFKDRDDLVASVARKCGEELASITGGQHYQGGGLAAFKDSNLRYLDYLLDHPGMARIVLWDISRIGCETWSDFSAFGVVSTEELKDVFDRGVADGKIRDVRPIGFHPYVACGIAAAALWHSMEHHKLAEEGDDQAESHEAGGRATLRTELIELMERLLDPALVLG